MCRVAILCAFCMLVSAASASAMAGSSSATNNGGSADLALGKPVVASSTESSLSIVAPKYAVDGSQSTRWSSNWSDPQWIYVDLGSVYNVTAITLYWERAYGKAFQIQVSGDAKTWKT